MYAASVLRITLQQMRNKIFWRFFEYSSFDHFSKLGRKSPKQSDHINYVKHTQIFISMTLKRPWKTENGIWSKYSLWAVPLIIMCNVFQQFDNIGINTLMRKSTNFIENISFTDKLLHILRELVDYRQLT